MFKRSLALILLAVFVVACAKKLPPIMTNAELIDRFEAIEITADEIERGVVVYLPDVFFEFDKHGLTDDARNSVELISSILNEPRATPRRISVEGHTDSHGTAKYNQALAQKRADVLKQELVFSNVTPDRIDVVSYGEERPIAPNKNPDGTDNPEGREQNRRVEVIVLNPTES